jgi:SAM-dependent methyltransferase
MQTLDLAQLSAGTIVAVDNHQPYLDALESTIRQHGFSGRVHIMNQDMSELDFEKGSFDVIWSEGAIYIMGFENGIRAWKRFLKHGGYMAVTELSWLRPDAPKEAEQFWARAYPAMKTLHGNLEIIRETGLQVVGHFVLPDSAWWETYYLPLEQNLARFRRKYDGDENAIRLADTEQMEIDLFRRYSDYYGYVFYLMQDR